MYYKNLFLLVMLMTSTLGLTAQERVSGKLLDKKSGQPIYHAKIGTNKQLIAAHSGPDGFFQLMLLPGDSIIRVEATDYLSATITVQELIKAYDVYLTSLRDRLPPTTHSPFSGKSDATGTIVLANEAAYGHIFNPWQLLQGRAAGLNITKTGSDPNQDFDVRLRGLSTFLEGQASPLVIIDDMPAASIEEVDPQDIESFEVIRDAGQSAYWGMRGANGIIYIRTKSGRENQSMLRYHGYASISNMQWKLPLMTASEFVGLRNINGNITDYGSQTVWQDAIAQNGLSHGHTLQLRGQSTQTRYHASFNFRDINGVVQRSGQQQWRGRVFLEQSVLNNRLKLSARLATSRSNADRVPYHMFRQVMSFNPTAPIYDESMEEYGGYFQHRIFDSYNPVAMIEQTVDEQRRSSLFGQARADFQIIPSLKAYGLFSLQKRETKTGQYYGKKAAYFGRDVNGLANWNEAHDLNRYVETGLRFQKRRGMWELTLQTGYSYQYFQEDQLQAQGRDFLTDISSFYDFSAAQSFSQGMGFFENARSTHKLSAFFGQAQLSHGDFWKLNAYYRHEGSSRLGALNQWAAFPGVQSSLNLSRWVPPKILASFEISAGFGLTGNVPTRSYLSQSLMQEAGIQFPVNGEFSQVWANFQQGNPNLGPERSRQWNIGFDAIGRGGRFWLSYIYYQQNNQDLIRRVYPPSPPNTGSWVYQNVGELQHNGHEISLGSRLINLQNLTWDLQMNYSIYGEHMVLRLDDDDTENSFIQGGPPGSPGFGGGFTTLVGEDFPLGHLVGYEFDGISNGLWQFKEQDGPPLFEDFWDSQQVDLGRASPSQVIGLENHLQFKKLEIAFLLRAMMGHHIANMPRLFYENPGGASAYNVVNTHYFLANVDSPPPFNDYFVEKGNYLRLSWIRLGLPLSIGKAKAKAYLAGHNLFTLTGYTGNDPEFRQLDVPYSNLQSNPLTWGLDRRNSYPLARTWVVGLEMDL